MTQQILAPVDLVAVINVSVYSFYFGSWHRYYFMLFSGGPKCDCILRQYSKGESVLAGSACLSGWLDSSQLLV